MVYTRRSVAQLDQQEEADIQAALALSSVGSISDAISIGNVEDLDITTKLQSTRKRAARSKKVPSTQSAIRSSTRVTKTTSATLPILKLRVSSRIANQSPATTVVAAEALENVASGGSLRVVAPKRPSRVRKDHPASAVAPKPQVSGRIQKSTPPESEVRRRKRFLLKLSNISYKRFDYQTLKTWNIRRKLPKDYWPYAHHPGFKLGHNPWEHLNWPAPDANQIREVHKLLADHHKKFDFDSYVAMPAHATEAKVTIDAIFQTLFAQSTDNEIAIDTHSRLCNTFPYIVEGKKYVGKMPNWHDIQLLERDELPKALQQGGFHEMRAGFVKDILDYVYRKNEARRESGKQSYECEGNPLDAKDFVPGMLSMDFLTDDDEDTDNSDEAVLGRLIRLSGIGIKSAMCIMAFSMKRPLFVVDVHVLRYAQWLGWVPKDAQNVDWVAQYLHEHIPDDIKYDLHNQIWSHCANENTRESNTRAVICPFCGSRPPAKDRDVSKHSCPLAEFLPPLEKRWGKAYTVQLRREKMEAASSEADTVLQANISSTESGYEFTADHIPKQKTMTDFFAKSPPTPPGSPDGTQTEFSVASQIVKVKEETSPVVKKTKKLNLNAKSHRFEDISKEKGEELHAAGYYLWEFRPMDNTFMEEWGTFEKKPRYRWERDTVMDRDVAVTWEYANDVLNHGATHKWSRLSVEDVVEEQIMTAMETGI